MSTKTIAADTFGQGAVVVTGVWGGRFDHTFSNVMSLIGSKSWGVFPSVMADEREVMVLLPGPGAFNVTVDGAPQAVSLLALFAACSGVTITGVHWPLYKGVLRQYCPYAIANRLEGGKTLTVEVESGWLGVYFCWEEGRNSLVD